MKKGFLIIFFLFSIFEECKLFGQFCNTTIFPSPGMTKITTNQNALNSPSGEAFWICSGLAVTVINSAGSLFVCEDNVTLIFTNSSGDDVFAKNGCVIINNSNSNIAVQCDTSQVALQNNSGGTITLTSHCPSLIYDYSLVGGSACQGVTGLEKQNSKDLLINAFPNPSADFIEVNCVNEKVNAIKFYNLSGELIYESSEQKIPVSFLQAGIYFLDITTRDGRYLKKFIKQ